MWKFSASVCEKHVFFSVFFSACKPVHAGMGPRVRSSVWTRTHGCCFWTFSNVAIIHTHSSCSHKLIHTCTLFEPSTEWHDTCHAILRAVFLRSVTCDMTVDDYLQDAYSVSPRSDDTSAVRYGRLQDTTNTQFRFTRIQKTTRCPKVLGHRNRC